MAKFFIIALAVMLFMQGYVSWHVWRILPFSNGVKAVVILLMLAALACLVLHFKDDNLPLGMASAAYEIGCSWLIIAFYLFMIFFVLDIGRIVHLVPKAWLTNNGISSLAITGVMLITFIGGNIHYNNKQQQVIQLTTDKKLDKPLKIVMMSDLHAGFHNRRSEIGRWVDMVNAEKPDLILIAGDMIDGNVRPLLEEGTALELQRLKAPTYACVGNHEYITGLNKALDLLEQTNIHVLRDATATVGNITIVGRDDRSNYSRKSLKSLMQGVDSSHYIILLDHQPYHLEQPEQCGVDLGLYGHTHHGQVWPLNWVTDAMYECAYGNWQRGKTHYYISSGIGIWGGKFRIGTSSEYAVIEIKN